MLICALCCILLRTGLIAFNSSMFIELGIVNFVLCSGVVVKTIVILFFYLYFFQIAWFYMNLFPSQYLSFESICDSFFSVWITFANNVIRQKKNVTGFQRKHNGECLWQVNWENECGQRTNSGKVSCTSENLNERACCCTEHGCAVVIFSKESYSVVCIFILCWVQHHIVCILSVVWTAMLSVVGKTEAVPDECWETCRVTSLRVLVRLGIQSFSFGYGQF